MITFLFHCTLAIITSLAPATIANIVIICSCTCCPTSTGSLGVEDLQEVLYDGAEVGEEGVACDTFA